MLSTLIVEGIINLIDALGSSVISNLDFQSVIIIIFLFKAHLSFALCSGYYRREQQYVTLSP